VLRNRFRANEFVRFVLDIDRNRFDRRRHIQRNDLQYQIKRNSLHNIRNRSEKSIDYTEHSCKQYHYDIELNQYRFLVDE